MYIRIRVSLVFSYCLKYIVSTFGVSPKIIVQKHLWESRYSAHGCPVTCDGVVDTGAGDAEVSVVGVIGEVGVIGVIGDGVVGAGVSRGPVTWMECPVVETEGANIDCFAESECEFTTIQIKIE